MPHDVELIVQMILAAVLAGALGLERLYRGRPAGLRTYMLVAIASTNFTQVGALGFLDLGLPHDPMRVAAQVVTGIGFLGAGAMWQARGKPQGLTTAAGLWISAAIGMMSAAGMYTLAISTAVIVVIILRGGSALEQRLKLKQDDLT